MDTKDEMIQSLSDAIREIRFTNIEHQHELIKETREIKQLYIQILKGVNRTNELLESKEHIVVSK